MMGIIFALASAMSNADKTFAMSIMGALALSETGILYVLGKTMRSHCPLIFSVKPSAE